ncbi:unnamed protein product [Vitrella brassicaformis CCMP3155]|uniref:Uncharacterized protein n=2 Tax=Vitrella brassicaformis TaxID=1169539 RepID=A0A0G4EUI7_VITBC|nr:unnamed protein product [Vitrella brassicaformis CCMP3155]|mmetsp:Transcript_50215/g.125850  ORF Transcript_50215/g.125850 Transcript_50215/m.125850 type:complete len:266 (+) Transcript_50215:221-1018(+)|eukprot:CEM01881.1 unnamed protein product [Vitrella brassicaformis CCMP3155]
MPPVVKPQPPKVESSQHDGWQERIDERLSRLELKVDFTMDALIKSFKEHLFRHDCHMAENKHATESLKEAMIKKAKEVRAEIAGVKEALGGVQSVQERHANQFKGGKKVHDELKADVRGLKALVEEVSSRQAAEEDARRRDTRRPSPPPVPPLPMSAIGEHTTRERKGSEAPPFPSLPPVCPSLARTHLTQNHSSNVNTSALTTWRALTPRPERVSVLPAPAAVKHGVDAAGRIVIDVVAAPMSARGINEVQKAHAYLAQSGWSL